MPIKVQLSPRKKLQARLVGLHIPDNTPTYMLVTDDGTEFPAVLVDEEVMFTATANDVRIGTVAASGVGVVEGKKVIPSYHTSEGYRLITSGKKFAVPLFSADGYDFTKLQAIICPYSGGIAGSVAAEKVAINEAVYPVQSAEQIATVTRDSENREIDFGLTNESESIYLLRYITFKEVV